MKPRHFFILGSLFVLAAMALPFASHHHDQHDKSNTKNVKHQRAQIPITSTPDTRTARPLRAKFENVLQAEQALRDFDISDFFKVSRKGDLQKIQRLRALIARIPTTYYNDLADQFSVEKEYNFKNLITRSQIYEVWGSKDLESAVADLGEIEDTRIRSNALRCVFRGATEINPQAAMQKAEALNSELSIRLEEQDHNNLKGVIFYKWIKSDPYSAIQWATLANVPDRLRNQWISLGLREWSDQNPENAKRWREQWEKRSQ